MVVVLRLPAEFGPGLDGQAIDAGHGGERRQAAAPGGPCLHRLILPIADTCSIGLALGLALVAQLFSAVEQQLQLQHQGHFRDPWPRHEKPRTSLRFWH